MSTKPQSVDNARPVECYKFTGPFGEFLYTDYIDTVTVNDETYEPRAISRSSIDISTLIDSPVTTDIRLPGTDQLSILYAYTNSPQMLNIEIIQVHHGDNWAIDFKRIWIGYGINYNTDSEGMTTIQTGSLLQAELTGGLSSVNYQRICNHDLYDARCKVNKATFTVTTTVTKIQDRFITVTDDGYGNGDLSGGTFINDATGEQRDIVDNQNNRIALNYKLVNVKVGDTVKLIRGCDHLRLGDCKLVFNNVVNYGGHDFIPLKNPFEQLNAENLATVTTEIRRQQGNRIIFPDARA